MCLFCGELCLQSVRNNFGKIIGLLKKALCLALEYLMLKKIRSCIFIGSMLMVHPHHFTACPQLRYIRCTSGLTLGCWDFKSHFCEIWKFCDNWPKKQHKIGLDMSNVSSPLYPFPSSFLSEDLVNTNAVHQLKFLYIFHYPIDWNPPFSWRMFCIM